MATPTSFPMYYPTNTKQAATLQSAQHWEKVLGRTANPGDTLYLWPVLTDPNTNKAIIVCDEWVYNLVAPKLTVQEKTVLDNALVPASDPRVQAVLNAQPKPPQ